MATTLLWSAGIVLETVILYRFLSRRLFRHYPFFFAYMAIVWTSSIALWPIYHWNYSAYANFFWAKQFLAVLAGFGVLLEIVHKGFQRYPGARALATTVVVGMFVILVGYFAYLLRVTPLEQANGRFSDLERDFRTMQALTLGGILGLIAYYGIDVGRNLRGIISGIGLYVGTTILGHALRDYAGPSFEHGWQAVQPYTYLVALLIWTATLWSYAPAPAPEELPELDYDYEAFARRTKEQLGTVRTLVSKVERP